MFALTLLIILVVVCIANKVLRSIWPVYQHLFEDLDKHLSRWLLVIFLVFCALPTMVCVFLEIRINTNEAQFTYYTSVREVIIKENVSQYNRGMNAFQPAIVDKLKALDNKQEKLSSSILSSRAFKATIKRMKIFFILPY